MLIPSWVVTQAGPKRRAQRLSVDAAADFILGQMGQDPAGGAKVIKKPAAAEAERVKTNIVAKVVDQPIYTITTLMHDSVHELV